MLRIIEYTSISKGIDGKEGYMCYEIRFSKSLFSIIVNLTLDSALKLQINNGKMGHIKLISKKENILVFQKS